MHACGLEVGWRGLGLGPHTCACVEHEEHACTMGNDRLTCPGTWPIFLFSRSQGIKRSGQGKAGGGGSSSPAQELGTALRFNRYLLRLDLSGNGVDGPMAVVIMEGATQHNALRRINLSSNPLGFEGCQT